MVKIQKEPKIHKVWCSGVNYRIVIFTPPFLYSIYTPKTIVGTSISPGLANSGAGINNWFLFVIIEQLLSIQIRFMFKFLFKSKFLGFVEAPVGVFFYSDMEFLGLFGVFVES